jgi:hypothetical protein
MNTHTGVEVELHSLFKLGIRWMGVVYFTIPLFYPRGKRMIHWIEDWMSPRDGLDTIVKIRLWSSPESQHRYKNMR